ncbi:uncharacterized protein LOC124831685 [Vigna umbellata]|uniref:uncharacterized protein LOC124831685 n=1 Tax=Vigna umbellata TaxID=87088 RepID=UPI001F5E40F8|nr:uncharacterized protein LOC124831685 [Vigna umbellata]
MEAFYLWWVNGQKQTLLMLNQILRWLKKPKVLRIICLASSVIGLLCYALSSSFHFLLGNWRCWKMLLYMVFRFIVFLVVLFSKARSSSISLPLESRLVFLVVIITSVYSFFYDNVVKGKPDAYSLISCAAFAIMSLGLSNLTQFGFQVDLVHFFCACLIIQLMKIKLWLVIVGAGFTYSLLLLPDHPRDTQEENLQLQEQNQVIIQVDDIESQDIMSQQANSDVHSTLGTSLEDGDLRKSDSHPQDADLIIQQLKNCIKKLEKENQMLAPMVCSEVDKYLKAVSDSKEVPQPDVNLVRDALPPGISTRLKETLKQMVDAGLDEECSDIYSKWRREFLEDCLRVLGLQFQTPNTEDVQMWLKTCKAAGKILFPIERRLCDDLFSGLSVADVSFEKVCKELTIGLVSFAYTTITTWSYLPNLLLEVVPKMSESLRELIVSQNSFHELSFVDAHEDDIRSRLVISNKVKNKENVIGAKSCAIKDLLKSSVTHLDNLMKEVMLKSVMKETSKNFVKGIPLKSLMKDVSLKSLLKETSLKSLLKGGLLKSDGGGLVEEIHEKSLIEEIHEGSLFEESREGSLIEEIHVGSLVEESHKGSLESDEKSPVEEFHEESHVKESHKGAPVGESHEGSPITEPHEEDLVEESHEGGSVEESQKRNPLQIFMKKAHLKTKARRVGFG